MEGAFMKSTVIKIASAALILFFFLPILVALGISLSGWSLLQYNFLMIFLFLIPIGLLAVSIVESLKKYETLAAVVASIAGIILLLIASNGVGGSLGLVGVGAGFVLSLLAYIAIIAAVVYDIVKKNKKGVGASGGSNPFQKF
jgi:hypothetical protein